jgi:long-subunit acyl-CoA synthetase (AMP-forming)
MSFAELEAAGAAAPVEPEPPVPEDLSTIMYTSGTTGKGAGLEGPNSWHHMKQGRQR